jgi:hypothetical protein
VTRRARVRASILARTLQRCYTDASRVNTLASVDTNVSAMAETHAMSADVTFVIVHGAIPEV